ncbi:MAG: hypothetical protein LC713_06890, partial [Actinobacteria bacterium]|nr:hypothetical protein [Actinomycetota bacterium]
MSSHDELFPEHADTPALRHAAERAGGIIADQVRSAVEAAEDHARSIRADAEEDARRISSEARDDSSRLRARIDAVVAPLEELLRDIRREADRVSAATPFEVETLTGAVQLDQESIASVEAPLASGKPEAGEWATPEPEEAQAQEATGDESADAAEANIADEQAPAAQTKAADVVEPAQAGTPSTTPCSECERSGSCSTCKGRGRRLGRRCGD